MGTEGEGTEERLRRVFEMAVMAGAIVRDVQDGRGMAASVTAEGVAQMLPRAAHVEAIAEEHGDSLMGRIGEMARQFVDWQYGPTRYGYPFPSGSDAFEKATPAWVRLANGVLDWAGYQEACDGE